MGLILGGKDKGEKGNLNGDLGMSKRPLRRCQAELAEAGLKQWKSPSTGSA